MARGAMEEGGNVGHAGDGRSDASASLARVMLTMSESVPSVRFRRYMPGNRVSGTIDTYPADSAALSHGRLLRNRTRGFLLAMDAR